MSFSSTTLIVNQGNVFWTGAGARANCQEEHRLYMMGKSPQGARSGIELAASLCLKRNHTPHNKRKHFFFSPQKRRNIFFLLLKKKSQGVCEKHVQGLQRSSHDQLWRFWKGKYLLCCMCCGKLFLFLPGTFSLSVSVHHLKILNDLRIFTFLFFLPFQNLNKKH